MSRIGKIPVPIPEDVIIEIHGNEVSAKGPQGEFRQKLPPNVTAFSEDGKIKISTKDASRKGKALHGLARSLIANLVEGVKTGFVKSLELNGIGFRAVLKEGGLVLNVGYSHPVEIKPPAGIEFKVAENKINVLGVDKQLVGQIASQIYKVRPPEPYKGKGIRFVGQIVRKKAGKSGKAATAK